MTDTNAPGSVWYLSSFIKVLYTRESLGLRRNNILNSSDQTMNQDQIYRQVQEHYGSAAGTTAIEYGRTVAKSFGYSEEELASIPKEANLGLSCGNPLAIASLRKVLIN